MTAKAPEEEAVIRRAAMSYKIEGTYPVSGP